MPSPYESPRTHRPTGSFGTSFGTFSNTDSPAKEPRTSAAVAGKAVAEGLKGLGGKGKGLLRMGREKLRGGDGVGH
jgi:hypothetical protein